MTNELKNETKKPEKVKLGYSDDVLSQPRPKRATSYDLTNIKLQLPTVHRQGFYRQWILEKDVPEYEKRLWQVVYDSHGREMREVGNYKTTDRPEYVVYMEIPEHWYKEAKVEEDAKRIELLEAMNVNQHNKADNNLKTISSIKNNLG